MYLCVTDKAYTVTTDNFSVWENCYVLILKSFDKMISHFRDSIWYATRINSIEDADHICNGVKP